ncbi:MAG: hypothetical protein FJX39_04935 [Alphaproteobacteria bacterium]|nr:hypothetical protein [Alphaproteobacteria bacterium]
MRSQYLVLLPITHTPPSGAATGIEIPAEVKQAIGLDDAPRWVIYPPFSAASAPFILKSGL